MAEDLLYHLTMSAPDLVNFHHSHTRLSIRLVPGRAQRLKHLTPSSDLSISGEPLVTISAIK